MAEVVIHDLGEHYPCSKVLLATVDGEPAGILGLKGGEWGGAHDRLDIVYVEPGRRRSGVARTLIDHARELTAGPVFHDGVLSVSGAALTRKLKVPRDPNTGNHGGRVLAAIDANRAGAQLFLWASSMGADRWQGAT